MFEGIKKDYAVNFLLNVHSDVANLLVCACEAHSLCLTLLCDAQAQQTIEATTLSTKLSTLRKETRNYNKLSFNFPFSAFLSTVITSLATLISLLPIHSAPLQADNGAQRTVERVTTQWTTTIMLPFYC